MKSTKMFGVLMMGMMATSFAFAEEPQQSPVLSSTNLVTKNYVDNGLIYVNDKTKTNAANISQNASDIEEIQGDINTINAAIGSQGDGTTPSSGLYQFIEDNRGPEYTNGNGITITDENAIEIDTSVVATKADLTNVATKEDLAEIEAGVVNYVGSDGIDVDSGTIKLDGVTDTGTYVYQDGAWKQVQISDTFSASIFNE